MNFLKYIFSRLLHVPRFLRRCGYIYWNRFLFGVNGVCYGRRMQIYNRIYLHKHPQAKVIIGDDFVLSSGEAFNPLCRNIRGCIFLPEPTSVLEIGNQSGISSACIWAKEHIVIGDRVKIGGDSILMDTDAHNLDYKIRSSMEVIGKVSVDVLTAKSAPIIIEDDVLIGTRSIILKGVTIGARSIIAAGSVVTKSIPSDCIAGGNPCKVIRYV